MTEEEIKFVERLFGSPGHEDVCFKCGSTERVEHHHITYQPSMTQKLCFGCHARITYLNTLIAGSVKVRLSNLKRIELFMRFLDEPVDQGLMKRMADWYVNEYLRVRHPKKFNKLTTGNKLVTSDKQQSEEALRSVSAQSTRSSNQFNKRTVC